MTVVLVVAALALGGLSGWVAHDIATAHARTRSRGGTLDLTLARLRREERARAGARRPW